MINETFDLDGVELWTVLHILGCNQLSWHTIKNNGNHIRTPLAFLQMSDDEFSVACEGYGVFLFFDSFILCLKFSLDYLMDFFSSIYMVDFNIL